MTEFQVIHLFYFMVTVWLRFWLRFGYGYGYGTVMVWFWLWLRLWLWYG